MEQALARSRETIAPEEWSFDRAFSFHPDVRPGRFAAYACGPKPRFHDRQLADAHRKAVLDADVAGVLAVYRDDAVEMPPFQAPIVGRAAIEQFYRNMFKGPIKVTGFTFIHTETTVHDDVAYDVGTYKRTMSAPTGPLEAVGPYVVILKRTDGAWKLAYIIYNCDCPPPGPPPSAPLH